MNIRIFFVLIALAQPAIAAESIYEKQAILSFLKEVFATNSKHVEKTERLDFKAISEGQVPRATIVMCSDSRVQSTAIDDTPVNDLFFIRNIGNQIETAAGSGEYGVRHLHTPVLLIVGHSACGAVKAALGDFSKESEPIQRELRTLNLKAVSHVDQGVVENVHHQVEIALEKFKDLIQADQLIVVGLVYDFRDDFKQGHGRLIVINWNGEKEPQRIEKTSYLSEMKDVAIGVSLQ